MNKLSAGLLMCKKEEDLLFFLVHPGGPLYSRRDLGVWSIPKGLPNEGELLEEAAVREFKEETGIEAIPPYWSLGSVTLKSRKIVHAWAFLGDWDPVQGITCNEFDFEWPRKSGKFIRIPEVDCGGWFALEEASKKINPQQVPFLIRAKELFD